MSVQNWVLVGTLVFGIISSGYASYQRGRAIEAEFKLKELAQVEKIDKPYNEKVKKLESEIVFLTKEFKKSMAEADELRGSITEREDLILVMNGELDSLYKDAPDKSSVEEEYADADIDKIRAGFTNAGYDYFIGGTN